MHIAHSDKMVSIDLPIVISFNWLKIIICTGEGLLGRSVTVVDIGLLQCRGGSLCWCDCARGKERN